MDKAEAEKILAVKAGEADAETKYLSGVGVARMRTAITDGFRESITGMSDSCGLKASEVVNMMLVTQYLDVLKARHGSAHSKPRASRLVRRAMVRARRRRARL